MAESINNYPEPRISFGSRIIGSGYPVLVIAEIGINHEGSLDSCVRMIDQAVAAGADAIKLQVVRADESYVPGTESYKAFKRAELSDNDIEKIFIYANKTDVNLFCTCGDFASFELINRFSPSAYKISSGLLTHIPLIKRIALTGKTIFLSTGMANEERIRQAVETARSVGAENIGLFQCTSLYPSPIETLNLSSIAYLESRFQVPTGFSDHSLGIQATPIAVASGARMIEKHFSWDHARSGFDHRLSLESDDFKKMVDAIRQAEIMMGSFKKEPHPLEVGEDKRIYRCLVAKQDIPRGAPLTEENLGIMRVKPGNFGMPPSAFVTVIGKTASRDIKRFVPLDEMDYR